MGSSPDEEDVERVDEDYVDPSSTSRDEIKADLESEGIDGTARDAFADRIVSEAEVVAEAEDAAGDRQVIQREDVERALDNSEWARNEGRDDALVDAAANELGAPSEASLQQARAQVAQRVDEDGTVRSDPSIDPLGGDDGREIGTVEEITRATGGRGGGMREGVEPTGRGTGTYYFEDSSGNRYPVGEVDL